jgi:SAM-dependent methyltransferase
MSEVASPELSESRDAAARASEGRSDDAIIEMVRSVVASRGGRFTHALDVGCGHGYLSQPIRSLVERYSGCDLVRYEGFPSDAVFHQADLNVGIPVPASSADLVVSVETIEHLENPRAFIRELARVCSRGGLLVVTTPNQLSLLSRLCLLLKGRFAAFLPVHYPAHITALLASDLLLIAGECGLKCPTIVYSDRGRIPGTARQWPSWAKGVWFSDNLALVAEKP